MTLCAPHDVVASLCLAAYPECLDGLFCRVVFHFSGVLGDCSSDFIQSVEMLIATAPVVKSAPAIPATLKVV